MSDFPSRLRLDEFAPARPGWSNRWHGVLYVIGTFAVGGLICIALWLAVLTVGAIGQ